MGPQNCEIRGWGSFSNAPPPGGRHQNHPSRNLKNQAIVNSCQLASNSEVTVECHSDGSHTWEITADDPFLIRPSGGGWLSSTKSGKGGRNLAGHLRPLWLNRQSRVFVYGNGTVHRSFAEPQIIWSVMLLFPHIFLHHSVDYLDGKFGGTTTIDPGLGLTT